MGDSGSPSRQTTTASASSVGLARASADAVTGAAAAAATGAESAADAAGAFSGAARAADATGISWASETAPGSHRPPAQTSRESRESRESRASRESETLRPSQAPSRDPSPDASTLGRSPSSSSKTLQPSPAPSSASSTTTTTTPTPTRRRSFFSRFSLPFRTPTLSFADFYIRPAAPHRKYSAGDHVLGAVVLAVVKPLRITHLTVSLRGLVRVFKDPSAAATAPLPADTVVNPSSTSSRLLGTSSSSYLGNGHALLFRDEIVLSGNGLLKPGNYEFEFDLIFPAKGLPSSIDFERGSICYVITATLTRPTTVAPVQSCDRKVYLVDPVDISAISKPRARTISLEPISKRSKKRKVVVVTHPPPSANHAAATTYAASNTPAATGVLARAMSTISVASGRRSCEPHEGASSERGSTRDSAHEPIEEIEQPGSRHPRSPAPTDLRSVDSVETGASGSSANRSGSGVASILAAAPSAPGSGSGSGLGSGSGFGSGSVSGSGSGCLGGAIVHIHSPAGSQTAASTAGNSAATTTGSSSTITTPGARSQTLQPAHSVSTATVSGKSDDRTITTTVELLKGGCLPGEIVNVKISVQHVKRIKSLHGVVVTLYRQGRIDSAPPELLFPSSGTSIAEADERESTLGDDGLPNSRDAAETPVDSSGLSRQQKKQKAKETREREKQLRERAKESRKNGKGKEVGGGGGGSRNGKGSKPDQYYLPKSKTGLGGLSLMSAGTCSVFRKDLSQSFSPLIIDPHTLQSSVTASVRVPEDAFATIKNVPGEMISFKYQLEVIVDLGGKLAGLLQSGAGGAGSTVVSGNPYDGKPVLSASSTLWGSGSHMIDTAPLRRQKGVICVPFEVIVGTTDTSRQHGRVGAHALTTASGLPAFPETQHQQQQQQQPQQQPPQPYASTQPPDWYPDDRKDQHLATQQPPSWSANGAGPSGSGGSAAAGAGGAGPSGTSGRPPYQQQPHDPPNPYYQQYQNQQPGYYDGRGAAQGPSHPPYTGALPPPSTQAPQYAPSDAMLAAERDPNISEKERIRRAEQRLLPSQPGQPGQPSNAASGPANGVGVGSSRDAGGYHGPSAPSAPSLDEVAPPFSSPTTAAAHQDPSAPPDFASLHLQAQGGPPPFAAGPSGQALPASATEDKQELERRRLLAEASAPPEFPEDYQDPAAAAAGPSRRSRRSGGSRSSRAVGGAASAPVLEEEDATHEQYLQRSGSASAPPHVPTEPAGEEAEGPSAPPADLVPAVDDAAAASAPSAGDVAGATDEDHYGEDYAYGPNTTADAAHGAGAAEMAEPLPRYER